MSRIPLLMLVASLAGAACASTRAPENSRAEVHHGQHPARSASASNDMVCGNSTVYFHSGSADLTDADRVNLRSLARCIERMDIDTLYVVGRADPVGTEGYNLDLGNRRAAAVAMYLRTVGVESVFLIKSRGEDGAADTRTLWPRERSATAMTSIEE